MRRRDEPLLPLWFRASLVVFTLVSLVVFRRDVAALAGPLFLTAEELVKLPSAEALTRSQVTLDRAIDGGSPYYWGRSWRNYMNTPLGPDVHVESHYRRMVVHGRRLMVRVAGPAPRDDAARRLVMLISGQIRTYPAQDARFLARLDSDGASDQLDPVYLPFCIDTTATNTRTWVMLSLALVLLGALVPGVVRELKTAPEAAGDPPGDAKKPGAPRGEVIRFPVIAIAADPGATWDAAARCPFCSDGLPQRKVVLCPACRAPHHAECWGQNGYRCTIYGCPTLPQSG